VSRHATADGGTFTRTGLHDALDEHQRAGLIKGWQLRPLDLPKVRGKPNWQWKVVSSDGHPHEMYTPRELYSLLVGLASARHALTRPSVRALQLAEQARAERGGTPVVRMVNFKAIERCPLQSLLPQHYNDDGSCRCAQVPA